MMKNPLDDLAAMGADRMMAMVKAMPDDIEPFNSEKLTKAEQLQRYAEVRDNPQRWLQIIQDQGLDAAIDYWKTMEVRYADDPLQSVDRRAE